MSGRQLAKAAADASSWPPRLWTTSPCRVVSPSQCLLFACVPGVCAMVFYASVDRLRRRVGLRIYIHRYLTYLFIMYVRAHARALIEMHFDNHSTRRHEPPPRRKSGHEHARTDCTAPPFNQIYLFSGASVYFVECKHEFRNITSLLNISFHLATCFCSRISCPEINWSFLEYIKTTSTSILSVHLALMSH